VISGSGYAEARSFPVDDAAFFVGVEAGFFERVAEDGD